MGALQVGFQLAGTGENLIMGMLAAHDARVKAAKEENAAVGQAVSALDADLKTVATAYQNGDISRQVAINTLTTIHNWYWAFIGPLQQGPTKGPQSPFPGSGKCYDASDGANCHCTGSACTVGCCIGCAAIDPTLSAAVRLLQTANAGSVAVCAVVGNKYGLQTRNAYTLTFVAPKVTNKQAEVTINKTTGIVTVGANPSASDVVIAQGVVSTTNAPDAGGDQIQHNPTTGADVNVTEASLLPGIPNVLLYFGAAILAIFVVVFALPPRG